MYGSETRARFLQVCQVLIETRRVLTETDLEKHIGRPYRFIFRLREGKAVIERRDVCQLVEVYKANPIYIYEGTGYPLIDMYAKGLSIQDTPLPIRAA